MIKKHLVGVIVILKFHVKKKKQGLSSVSSFISKNEILIFSKVCDRTPTDGSFATVLI